MKTISKKTIVISIILLLVGVSVSTAISVDTKSTKSNNQNEDCRECNEVSDADLVRVERLLNRVEVYSKLLLVLSKFNPEIKEEYEGLSKRISTLSSLKLGYENICNILIGIGIIILGTAGILEQLLYSLSQTPLANGLLFNFLYSLTLSLYMIFAYGFFLMDFFDCWGYLP
jgi:hypothetical protein